ncbi:HAMP domain-containing histidine kinase [Nocardiopsis sp. EMB25]|nr:HAMP domain-containing sensor histidine kinase [Nocardiopsis sp. EMB25]MCY9784421.1 HAMP domain-containing histidine kinase [Nocardiopsis sp. EMB25]
MTIWAVAVLIIVIGLWSLATAIAVRELVLDRDRDQAARAARVVIEDIAVSRYEDLIPAESPVLWIQVIDRETHEVLAFSAAEQGEPPLAIPDATSDTARFETTMCGDEADHRDRECLLVVGYEVNGSAYGDVWVLAATPRPTLLETNTPEIVMGGMSGLLLGITAVVTWYGVGRALRPVERISAELDRMSASNLDRRLPVPRSQDEIAHLARTANASLERLAEAVAKQRRFVSDASHELRNPIAGMRTRIEVELSDPEPDPHARELLLTALLADTERLENIVADLLELARLDTGATAASERVDLSALVAEELVGRRNGPVIQVHSAGPVWVLANRLRVARVLTNLVANAERHARSRIDITVDREGESAVLRVHDDGAGVPERDRERVFERFARLRESRERDPGGSGLGLPISREIAEDYGGTLTVGASDRLGGAVFTFRLPAEPGRLA